MTEHPADCQACDQGQQHAYEPLDMRATYAVASYPGVAFYLTGYVVDTVERDPVLVCESDDCPHDVEMCWALDDAEEVTNYGMVRAVMVGDDAVHTVDVSDLTMLDGDVCSCGQIGCDWR